MTRMRISIVGSREADVAQHVRTHPIHAAEAVSVGGTEPNDKRPQQPPDRGLTGGCRGVCLSLPAIIPARKLAKIAHR
jgi:hypothetical protein